MTDRTAWTIGELAAAAEVTPRTIRYYTAEGLLPPPDQHGKYARYGHEHLRRLQLIARLKAAYLPLNEIRARIDQLSAHEVDELLAKHGTPPSAAEAGSAADYVAQVMQSRSIAPPTSTLLGYKTSTPQEPAALRTRASPVEVAGRQSRSGPPQPTVGTELRRPVQRSPGTIELAEEIRPYGERWQRMTLAPGIELHVHEAAAGEMREPLDRLVELAREIFSEEARP